MDSASINPTEKSLSALENFMDLVDVPRFRKNFRHILLYYLMMEHEELMSDFEWFIEDVRFFFEFLDELEG